MPPRHYGCDKFIIALVVLIVLCLSSFWYWGAASIPPGSSQCTLRPQTQRVPSLKVPDRRPATKKPSIRCPWGDPGGESRNFAGHTLRDIRADATCLKWVPCSSSGARPALLALRPLNLSRSLAWIPFRLGASQQGVAGDESRRNLQREYSATLKS